MMKIQRLERAVLKNAGQMNRVDIVKKRMKLESRSLALRAAVAEVAAELLATHKSVADDIEEELLQFRSW